MAPGEDGTGVDADRWAPGLARVGSGRDEKEPKKGRKDSDKDKEGKDKKGKKGSKKDKDRKGSDKDDEKDRARKGSEKDEDKDKKDKHDKEKKGGLFGKLKKPKESPKAKQAQDEAGSRPGDQVILLVQLLPPLLCLLIGPFVAPHPPVVA